MQKGPPCAVNYDVHIKCTRDKWKREYLSNMGENYFFINHFSFKNCFVLGAFHPKEGGIATSRHGVTESGIKSKEEGIRRIKERIKRIPGIKASDDIVWHYI